MDYLGVYDRYICKSLIAGFADFQTDFGRKSANLQNSGWLFIWKGDSENDPTKPNSLYRFPAAQGMIAGGGASAAAAV